MLLIEKIKSLLIDMKFAEIHELLNAVILSWTDVFNIRLYEICSADI